MQYKLAEAEIAHSKSPFALTLSQGPPVTATLVGSMALTPIPVPSCPELPSLQMAELESMCASSLEVGP